MLFLYVIQWVLLLELLLRCFTGVVMPNFEAVYPELIETIIEHGAAAIGLALIFVGFLYVMRVIKIGN